MLGNSWDTEYSFLFDCLNQALGSGSLPFPTAVCYRDASSPFTIDATLGQWQIAGSGSGEITGVNITVASGILEDADKGAFPLSGLVLTMRVALRMEPVAVVNPGVLSELQQVGLLDAVSTYLNDPAIHYAIATIEVAPAEPAGRPGPGSPNGATLTGLLAVLKRDDASAIAAFVIPGDLFLAQAVMPGLAAALGLPDSPQPSFSFDAASHAIVNTSPRKLPGVEAVVLSYAMSIAADRLVTTAEAACSLKPGIESTFTVTCSHSAQYDAGSRTLSFVQDADPAIRKGDNIPGGEELRFQTIVDFVVNALAKSTATASTKCITRLPLSDSDRPVACPATGEFQFNTAGLNGAVYLQGNWS